MNEKSLHRSHDVLKFKKQRFFYLIRHEGFTGTRNLAERFGVSQSTILYWKKEYDAKPAIP